MPFLIKHPSDDFCKAFLCISEGNLFPNHPCMQHMLATLAGILCKEINLLVEDGWCGVADDVLLLPLVGEVVAPGACPSPPEMALDCLPFFSWDSSWLLALLLLG
jgi:hypothetical protein